MFIIAMISYQVEVLLYLIHSCYSFCKQIRNSQHKTNTLIFGLVDGYYGAPDMHTKLVSVSLIHCCLSGNTV